MPPGDAPARRKPAAPPSLAYVLSQTADLRWHVVFRSGATSSWEVKEGLKAKTVQLDPKRPDYEADGAEAALALMEGIAEDRERFALALPGERHALFIAVLASDLAAYGVRP